LLAPARPMLNCNAERLCGQFCDLARRFDSAAALATCSSVM